MLRLFAISGSLRTASLNSALLRALVRVAAGDIYIEYYTNLAKLPLFNPDLEVADPAPVAELRQQIIHADGVIIASPEYAHGISGVMKNALDWVVGNEAFVYKPVMLLNTSPRAIHAQAALREVLATMSACIVESASIAVPLLGSGLDEAGIVANKAISAQLLSALQQFKIHIELLRSAAS